MILSQKILIMIFFMDYLGVGVGTTFTIDIIREVSELSESSLARFSQQLRPISSDLQCADDPQYKVK